jgi:hypothetical protein
MSDWGCVKVIHREGAHLVETAIYEPGERELCITVEEVIREKAQGGTVSFIVHILDPDQRMRVKQYLQGVLMELTHDDMEGI